MKNWGYLLIMLLIIPLGQSSAWAMTSAGVKIANAAVSTYQDHLGYHYSAVSNTVYVTVRQIYALNITPNGTASRPGQHQNANFLQTVYLSYVLENKGNGIDFFSLTSHNLSEDDYDLKNIKIYRDRNQNGVVDSGENEYSNSHLPEVAAGERLSLVVSGYVAWQPDVGKILVNLRGQSQGDPKQIDSDNVSEITIVESGYLVAHKKVDKSAVLPGEEVTFTITQANNGIQPIQGKPLTKYDFNNDGTLETYTGIVLVDSLPPETSYVSGTSRGAPVEGFPIFAGKDGVWKKDDTLVDSVVQIGFFLPEDPTSQVALAVDQQASFTFTVLVSSSAPAGDISNHAIAHYVSDGIRNEVVTNTVYVTIIPSNVILLDDTDDNGAPGAVLVNEAATVAAAALVDDDFMTVGTSVSGFWETFTNEAWNFGNVTDTINISTDRANSSLVAWNYESNAWNSVSSALPDNIVVYYYRPTGQLLTDSDLDGVPDTGPLAVGERFPFLSKVYFPPGSRNKDVIIAIQGHSRQNSEVSDYTYDKIEKVMPTSIRVQVRVSVAVTVGVSTGVSQKKVSQKNSVTTLTNYPVYLHEYNVDGDYVTSMDLYSDSSGDIILNRENGTMIPLYKLLNEGDDAFGSVYRLSLKDNFGDYTYYLTPFFYKSDFDQVTQAGEVFSRDEVTVEVEEDGTVVLTTPLDPAGFVYSGVTGQKIDQACVTFYRCQDQRCEQSTVVAPPTYPNNLFDFYPDGKTRQENPQLSGATDGSGKIDTGKGIGAFEFIIANYLATHSGWYYIEADFDCGLAGANAQLADTLQPVRLNASAEWSPATNPILPYQGEKFYIDDSFDSFAGATNMQIPLLPVDLKPLEVKKTVNQSVAEIGDLLKFTVTVKNPSQTYPVYGASLIDDLPTGLRYKANSARFEQQPLEPTISDDGQQLIWSLGDIAAEQTVSLTYYAIISADSRVGKKINTAAATAWVNISRNVSVGSNPAYASFVVRKGLFSDRGYIFGKVFIDDNNNRLHDEQEQGLEGIKLYLEDGRYVVTDGEGKYHLDKVKAGTHMVKLDPMTLPANTQLALINNRNMDDPNSMFVDLLPGDFFKANFRLRPDQPETQLVAKQKKISGTLVVKRRIKTFIADASSQQLSLQHEFILRNTSKAPFYEVQYTEQSPIGFNTGTFYRNEAPLSDPGKKGRDRFILTIPVIEPQEEIIITFNSEMPTESVTINGEVSFKTEPHRQDQVAAVKIPLVLTQPKPDEYQLTVYFDLGEKTLSKGAKKNLDQLVAALRKQDYKKILITATGYADQVAVRKGSKEINNNLTLSLARSEAVSRYLKAKLIDMRKVTTAATRKEVIKQAHRYGLHVLETDAKAALAVMHNELKAKGLPVYQAEEFVQFTQKRYHLWVGPFATEKAAQQVSQQYWKNRYRAEPLILDRHEKIDQGGQKIMIQNQAKSNLTAAGQEQGSKRGNPDERRTELHLRPFKESEVTQQATVRFLRAGSRHQLTLQSNFLYPQDRLEKFSLFFLFPKGVSPIPGTGTLNDESIEIEQQGRFYTLSVPEIAGRNPVSVNFAFRSELTVSAKKIYYFAIASNQKGKPVVLFSTAPSMVEKSMKIYYKKISKKQQSGATSKVTAARKTVVHDIVMPEKDVLLSNDKAEIIIAVPLQVRHQLLLNDEPVSQEHLGESNDDTALQLKTLHYYGLPLQPGKNHLRLIVGQQLIAERTLTLTGDIGKISTTLYPKKAVADGKSPAYLVVELLDGQQNRVHENSFVDVRVDKGELYDDDDNRFHRFQEKDFQLKIVGGKGTIKLSPSHTSERRQVTVKFGALEEEIEVVFYPEERPWIVAGNLEAAVGLNEQHNKSSGSSGVPYNHENSFNGNAGLFAKGMVDEYTVTLRYNDEGGNTLLEENNVSESNDELYPIYGDESEQFFEAQSQRNIYAKIEKEHDFFLYGDYQTAFGEGLKLNRYQRTLNGALVNVEGEKKYRLTSFISENKQQLIRDELEGKGISGPYYLENQPVIENSEKVWVEIRDRYQPHLILSRKQLTRVADYTVNYEEGWLLFKTAINHFDTEFNPIRIVVLYEAESLDEKRYMYGLRGEKSFFADQLRLGASWSREEHALQDKDITGLDLRYEQGPVTLLAEVAESSNYDQVAATPIAGQASQVKVTYEQENKKIATYYQKQDTEFTNLSAESTGQKNETMGLVAEMSFDEEKTTLKGEVKQENSQRNRQSVTTRLKRKFNDELSGSVGTRWNREEQVNAERRENTQGLVNIQYRPWERLSLSASREQLLSGEQAGTYHPTKTAATARYRIFDSTYAYVQGELQEDGENDARLSTFGLESQLTENTSAYSKYKLDDSVSGWRNQAHLGINHTFKYNDDLSFDIGGEEVKTVSGNLDDEDYTAIRAGVNYRQEDRYTLTGRYEVRFATPDNDYLVTVAGSVKLNDDYTLLVKERYFDAKETDNTLIFGLAYRPVGWDAVNMLSKLSWKTQGGSEGSEKMMGMFHLNYQYDQDLTLSAEYAFKQAKFQEVGSTFTDLVRGRAMWDLTDRFDAGGHAGYLQQHDTNTGMLAYGVEVGARLYKNIWLSGGYNFEGFTDRDFENAEYWAAGPYIKLRIKFDEETVKGVIDYFSGD